MGIIINLLMTLGITSGFYENADEAEHCDSIYLIHKLLCVKFSAEMGEVMIKQISKNDISECVNVIRTSFLTVADELGFNKDNAPRFTAFATTAERLIWQLENEHRAMYAYFYDNKIVGYYSLLVLENNECELNNLCVLPEYRHMHIGEQLVKDAYTKARLLDCTKINIGIVEENTVLRQWYEVLGFRHVSTKKFDFFPFTCGYMEKDLKT